ncbi:carbonic anhydrase [Paraburkholderia rhynchosiae]|uniref:hypothetical protein n=1 Tax=Paraburkholderia rhynchosiae TaxID=487049 RepID=UPI001FCA2388|nr:hypothetical protein [Paraburkholderia rhynchosiae]
MALDVAALRANSELPDGLIVSGLVYDVKTGRIETVVPRHPCGRPRETDSTRTKHESSLSYSCGLASTSVFLLSLLCARLPDVGTAQASSATTARFASSTVSSHAATSRSILQRAPQASFDNTERNLLSAASGEPLSEMSEAMSKALPAGVVITLGQAGTAPTLDTQSVNAKPTVAARKPLGTLKSVFNNTII